MEQGLAPMIPEELKARNQWLPWVRHEKRGKVPVTANGAWCDAHDSLNWHDYETAEMHGRRFAGVAFVISAVDPYTGVDLDNCLEDGKLRPWAAEILARFDGVTYAEISPSGTGIKLTTRARKPGNASCAHTFASDRQKLECYDNRRFWTVTGNLYSDYREIGDGQAAVNWLCEKYLSPARPQVKTTAPTADRIARYMATIEPAISGCNGHGKTFYAACKLVIGYGLTPDAAFPYLAAWNDTCVPPWNEKELWHKLHSADQQGGERGNLLREDGWLEPDLSGVDLSGILNPPPAEPAEPAGPPAEKSEESLPRELLDVPGLIGDIMRWNLETSSCPQPQLAFGAAMALVGTITGRKVRDYRDTRTNIYVLGLAPSGSGKEWARTVNKQLLIRAGGEAMVSSERIGSSAGVVSTVAGTPACLFQVDEIGRLLETMQDAKRNPHLYNIASVLMQLYSNSNTLWVGDAYADTGKIKRIMQPHACLYGTTVPGSFWSSITKQTLRDGFVGRLIPVEAGYVDFVDPPKSGDPPDELVARIRWWLEFTPGGGNLSAENPTPVVIAHTDAAKKRATSQSVEIGKRLKRDEEVAAALWSRSSERVSKLALLFAVSRMGPGEHVCIELGDVDRAIAISNVITREILQKSFDRVSENDWESKKKRLLRVIEKTISASELTRKTQWLKRRERQELLSELLEVGEIAATEQPGTGKKPVAHFSRMTALKSNNSNNSTT
jgi:hypothetical protein